MKRGTRDELLWIALHAVLVLGGIGSCALVVGCGPERAPFTTDPVEVVGQCAVLVDQKPTDGTLGVVVCGVQLRGTRLYPTHQFGVGNVLTDPSEWDPCPFRCGRKGVATISDDYMDPVVGVEWGESP